MAPCSHSDPLCETCFLKIICEAYFQRRIATCPLCRAEWRPEPESEQDSATDEANSTMLEAAEAGYDNVGLTIAARRGLGSIARLMIARGATNYNEAMVGIGASYGHENIVRLLLDHGASDYALALRRATANAQEHIVR